MIVDIKFYERLALEMKKLKCSEMCIKVDDVIELSHRLREAEKDAASYRLLMDEKVKCPYCESEFDDFTAEADFIGWHGMCAKCFMSEESNA